MRMPLALESERPSAGSQAEVFSLGQGVGFLSCAAIVAQAWDSMVSFSDEVEYLWKGKFRLVKALYFTSRYGLLGVQVISELLYLHFRDGLHPYTARCAEIFVYKAIVGHFGLKLVEIILLLRVYTLYNRSFKIKYLLLSAFVIATVLEIAGNTLIVPSLAKTSGCIAPPVKRAALILFGIGAGFCQCVVFVTTLAKILASGRSRTPLTSMMLKEGLVSFIFVFALLAIMFVSQVVHTFDLVGNSINVGKAAFSWYMALLSVAGSRLILNMRKVAVNHRSSYYREYEEDGINSEGAVQSTSVNE